MRKTRNILTVMVMVIIMMLPVMTAHAATGWHKENGNWYYYQGATKQTGWFWNNETKYYLGAEGAMHTGWQKIDGSWYYFRGDGAMHTGWWNDGDTWYYLTLDGSMAHDCYAPDGHWLESSGAWNAEKADWNRIDKLNRYGITEDSQVNQTKLVTFIINWDTDSKDGLIGNDTRDIAITSALLGRTSVDTLLSTEKEVYKVAKAFLDGNIKKSDSDEAKVKKIVAYLRSTVSYDYTFNEDIGGTYGALIKHKAICDGYTRSFKMLANAAGLECYFVGGTAINNQPHAWNVVRVNGKWTNVDVTNNEVMLTDAEFSQVMATRGLYHQQNVPACN